MLARGHVAPRVLAEICCNPITCADAEIGSAPQDEDLAGRFSICILSYKRLEFVAMIYELSLVEDKIVEC